MALAAANYVVGDLSALLLSGDVASNERRLNPQPDEEEEAADSGSDSESSPEVDAEEEEEEEDDSDDQNDQEPTGVRAKRTVFVGNLPLDLPTAKLRSMFARFGAIESVRFRSIAVSNHKVPRKVAVSKQLYLPQRTTKNAYVVFKDEASVEPALKVNGDLVQGKHIRVDRAGGDGPVFQPNLTVFVGNLPFDIDDEDLWEFFESCGKIVGVRVVRDKQYGIGKGFAFISFDNASGVNAAIALNDTPLKERAVRVYRASAVPSGQKRPPQKRGQKRGAAGADQGKGRLGGRSPAPRHQSQQQQQQPASNKRQRQMDSPAGAGAGSAGGAPGGKKQRRSFQDAFAQATGEPSWQGAQAQQQKRPQLKRSNKGGGR